MLSFLTLFIDAYSSNYWPFRVTFFEPILDRIFTTYLKQSHNRFIEKGDFRTMSSSQWIVRYTYIHTSNKVSIFSNKNCNSYSRSNIKASFSFPHLLIAPLIDHVIIPCFCPTNHRYVIAAIVKFLWTSMNIILNLPFVVQQ